MIINNLKKQFNIRTIKDFYSLSQEQQNIFFSLDNLLPLCKEEHRKLHKVLGNNLTYKDSIDYINKRRAMLGTEHIFFTSKCG